MLSRFEKWKIRRDVDRMYKERVQDTMRRENQKKHEEEVADYYDTAWSRYYKGVVNE